MGKYILITGGELFNKGAEAMTFTTVSEMKEKFPDKEIILLSTMDYEKKEAEKGRYKFKMMPLNNEIKFELLGGAWKSLWKFYRTVRKTDKDNYKNLVSEMDDILKDTHAIVDISGYALSSQWGIMSNIDYVTRVTLAKKYGIPFYIMPQSIGPFEYGGFSQNVMDHLIRNNLNYPEIIYAREPEGYQFLTEKYNLTNVEESPDLVLLNREVDYTNVFYEEPHIDEYNEVYGVGITPNMKNFEHGNKESIIDMYKQIIDTLLVKDENIYLIRHSQEDLEVCKTLKELYIKDDRVILVENELSSYEFNSFVKNLKFLIGSRYHSIIHAYKNTTPCIAIGWATKYKVLLDKFDQSQYIFDVRGKIDMPEIIKAVQDLYNNYEIEERKIEEKIAMFQEKNMFDIIK